MRVDKAAVRVRAFQLIDAGKQNIATALAAEFGMSRQAAHGHLTRLVLAGELTAAGATRSRVYKLAIIEEVNKTYHGAGLSEDTIWREIGSPLVKAFPENVRDIWHYGMTEMVNNAIDHSGSPSIFVHIQRTALHTAACVMDDGEGIFLKIQKALNLFDPRESILELAKGKLTTDPANHTGEGIFFTSKMFDEYEIRSGNLYFAHGAGKPDFLLEHPNNKPGTLVYMKLANDSPRITNDVFYAFAPPEELTFAKTIVPVRLALYEGEKLVSRSQAKRLTMRFERFQTVILDFDGVETIGQAFADEVFRVFQNAHPSITMIAHRMTTDVEAMVNRALSKGKMPTKE